jgi:enoyl-CoA hydratase/carnithine racemase
VTADLIVEHRDGVRWLTLARPQRRNALSLQLVGALTEQLHALPDDVCAVVIAAQPPVFCAGGDLHDLHELASRGPAAVTDVVYGAFQGLVRSIAAAPVPVIAAIDGPALGGGLDLLLACDLRIATPAATFTSSWVTLGLVPGMGGAHMLTSLVGAARAAQIVLLAQTIDAESAAAWGLVNAVVSSAQLEEHVAALAQRIASLPALGVRRSKEALRRARDRDLVHEHATLAAVQASLGIPEAIRAVAGPGYGTTAQDVDAPRT